MIIWRKKINGKIYDKNILDIVGKSLAQGANSIDIRTAKRIFDLLYYSYQEYPDISKDTIKYLRKTYRWHQEADLWFRAEIRRWAAERSMKKR